MAPKVTRAKTSFQWYQSEMISVIKKELGPGASMGDSMTALSKRWKSLSEEDRLPFQDMEAQDRARFEEESLEADRIATEEQEARRRKLVKQDGEVTGSRGARKRIDAERNQKEEQRRRRKEQREADMDDDEREAIERKKAAKRKETRDRQKAREASEKAVADRHKKLDKQASTKANQRLEYLLKQSSIFAKLKMGGEHHDSEEEASKVHHRGGAADQKETHSSEEDDMDDEEREDHVFLTKQPTCIKFGTLKGYQLEGLNWMIHLAEKGLNGILADEMGLGKTLQSISILAYHFEYQRIQGPHLVCVPKSTLSNWMNEFKRWCPSFRVIRFHGNKDAREELIEKYFTNEAAADDGKRPSRRVLNKETGEMEDDNSKSPRQWDVCITTYEVCNTERKVLLKFPWRYLVIDEAHRLKNEASMFSKTVRTFNTSHRLLLTGTPLQNNLHELWALLNFLLPDIFSSADQFDEWFNLEVDDEEAKKNMISQLHKILRPFMLRRLKADVAKGLPPKTETLVMVGMSKMQKQLYKKLLLRDIDSITGKTTNKARTAILNIVMQLRKCCGHPYLFEGVEDRTLDPLGDHLVENCGKLSMLNKLLIKLKERGSRALIFTQMTRILDILEDFMVMRGYKYCRIDGNTAYEDREEAIAKFNEPNSEKFCFILSTRAGGLGINLQTADTCILYDSDWNPQADLQAQDRCHRLGQKKPVSVFRLVSENTIEEKIVERAQQKLKLDAMVVQQGRLKDKDKVTKDEIMNAVRFGADAVFRSEESTITDDDIDVILERGRAKTEELAKKIQAADKGDLLDFSLDGGVAAQTFEGIDYSDRELRNQLRLLAADSMGKRERRPPPTNYNPIMQPKKSMVVNNQRIKLPRSLRLPRMEDHHFYNRERLLELGKMEFQTYATLREIGQLPPREFIDENKTLLPPELATEKLELLEEGFGDWTRSQYFHFVKAAAKFGRDDIASIAVDMDMQEEEVSAYGKAFWEYGESELKDDEWERVKSSIEKGEKKIAKRKELSELLSKFISTFDDPRSEMVFANKGTTHFALEQDRALLCAVEKFGYGNWDTVREELRTDNSLIYQHLVQGMTTDMIAKRCDYRIRQMVKELEAREKVLKNLKPPSVIAAEASIQAIKEMDTWESNAINIQLDGKKIPSMDSLSEESKEILQERLQERESLFDRLREIEVQVRGCKVLADETRESIYRGDQYVNYSNITLKAGGPSASGGDAAADALKASAEVEAKINPEVLRVPLCGVCAACTDESSRKLCVKRLEVRNRLFAIESKKLAESLPKVPKPQKRKLDEVEGTQSPTPNAKKDPPPKKKKIIKKANGVVTTRVTSQGNKRMSIPDELFPEFCQRIGPKGTAERMKVITQFAEDHPSISVRQVTMKFSEITTRTLPGCVSPPEKKSGRAFLFFLRPRYYKYLPAEERPDDWEKYAHEDELLWKEEKKAEEKEKEMREKKVKDMMVDASSKSPVNVGESDIMNGPDTAAKEAIEAS